MRGKNTLIMSVNIITLGCSKNLVDSEKILRQFDANGFLSFHNSSEFTDVVIINTCGFILDAKTESIETILSYADAKKRGFIRKLIVTGCLSQRYADTLKMEIPEVDAFFGVNQEKAIINSLGGNYYIGLLHERTLTTPSHYAYLKIAEGCNRNCSFCAIPTIRGKQFSLPIDELMKEAEFLVDKGVREILLIAQDLTSYGLDNYKERALGKLLKELNSIHNLEWIRLHYTYPLGFSADDIISTMKKNTKICKYLDLPIQHINNKILNSMNRGHSRKDIEDLIKHFRHEIPDITIRTTLITGFPGETEQDFIELKDYVQATRFDRLGVFTYSEEEGTPAADKLKDDVPQKVKEARKEEILSLQQGISLQLNLDKIGKIFKVIIDRKEGEFYAGRTEYDSPEIDNEVLIPMDSAELIPGQFCEVLITDALEFDLFGEVRG
jgi:ribosomal protein S12 methylthiotransferase